MYYVVGSSVYSANYDEQDMIYPSVSVQFTDKGHVVSRGKGGIAKVPPNALKVTVAELKAMGIVSKLASETPEGKKNQER